MAVKERKQDEGYAWVVLAASFLNNALASSVFVSPSVYMVDWMEEFDTNKAKVTAVGSLLGAIACSLGLFSGPLISRFGCRCICMTGAFVGSIGMLTCVFATSITHLYISFGVILGIGHSMYYIPPILVTQFYFNKKRALASGISLCGHSTGSFIFMPLLRLLIRHYGWRGTMLIHSAMVLQIAVCGSLYRPFDLDSSQKDKHSELESPPANLENRNTNPKTESGQHDTINNKSVATKINNFIKTTWDWSLFKNKLYVLFLISFMLANYPIELCYKMTALKSYTIGDLNKVQAALLPSFIGFASTSTRICVSFIANLGCVNRTVLLASAIALHGMGCILSTLAFNMYSYGILMVMFGIGLGAQMTVMTTTMVDLIGVHRLVNAQSFSSLGGAITLSTGLILAGYVIDLTDNYDLPYYIYGAMGLFGSFLMAIVAFLQHKQRRKDLEKLKQNSLTVKLKRKPHLSEQCHFTASIVSLTSVG